MHHVEKFFPRITAIVKLHTCPKLYRTYASKTCRMASPQRHHIVSLDNWVPTPAFSFPHTLNQYPRTSAAELPERMKDASIVLISNTPITRQAIESSPRLQLIACNSTGTDHVDKDAAREHGVTVCRVPAQNTDSVSEHAFALYFAVRRKIIHMHNVAMDGDLWKSDLKPAARMGTPPRTNGEEVLVVVGYGAIGKFQFRAILVQHLQTAFQANLSNAQAKR
jgi:glycerate dehydrogenase